MVNKVFIDEQGILTIIVVGDQTAETVREMGEKLALYTSELRARNRPVLILDNLLQLGRAGSEARREVGRIARHIDCDRAVMVGGGSLAMRYTTNLMLRAVGRSNFRYFTRIEPACRWLRQP